MEGMDFPPLSSSPRRRRRGPSRPRLQLAFCPSPGAYLLGAPGAVAPLCIAVSPGACSAVALAMNGWAGRFSCDHARRLLSEPAHARFAAELAPLLVALERAGAVYVAFFRLGDESAAAPRRTRAASRPGSRAEDPAAHG